MAFEIAGQCGACSQALAEEVGASPEAVARGEGLLALCDPCELYRSHIINAGLPFSLELLRTTHEHEDAFIAASGHGFDFVAVYRSKAEHATWDAEGRFVAEGG